MKKNVVALLAFSFLVGISFPLLAQEEDVQKVKVNVEITKDGKTERIVKEYDVSADGNMVWELDDDNTDGHHEVIFRETFDSDQDLPWMGPPEGGEVSTKAFLGVIGYTINEDGGGDKRVRITKVIEGEAAAKAGLKNEDIIETIDGKKIENYEELVNVIRAKSPGDIIKIKVTRDGKRKEVTATLGERKMRDKHFYESKLNKDENVEIIIESFNAVSKDDNEVIKKATGVNPSAASSFSKVSIELFPNPSKDNFKYKLKIDEGGELERIILNSKGDVIETQSFDSKDGVYEGEVNLSNQPAGNYILIFKRGDKIITEKLMKQ